MGMQTIKIPVKFSFCLKYAFQGTGKLAREGEFMNMQQSLFNKLLSSGERRQMSMFSSPSGYSHWFKGASANIIPSGCFWNKASTSSLETKQNNEMGFLEVVVFQGHFLCSLGSQVIVLIQAAPSYLSYLLFRMSRFSYSAYTTSKYGSYLPLENLYSVQQKINLYLISMRLTPGI